MTQQHIIQKIKEVRPIGLLLHNSDHLENCANWGLHQENPRNQSFEQEVKTESTKGKDGNLFSWINGFGRRKWENILCREKCIDGNIAMNDFAIDGDWNEETVEKFLTAAYEVYESP